MSHQSPFFASMVARIKDLFAPPIFEEEEKSRIARILSIILWSIVAVVSALILIWLVTGKPMNWAPTLLWPTV